MNINRQINNDVYDVYMKMYTDTNWVCAFNNKDEFSDEQILEL